MPKKSAESKGKKVGRFMVETDVKPPVCEFRELAREMNFGDYVLLDNDDAVKLQCALGSIGCCSVTQKISKNKTGVWKTEDSPTCTEECNTTCIKMQPAVDTEETVETVKAVEEAPKKKRGRPKKEAVVEVVEEEEDDLEIEDEEEFEDSDDSDDDWDDSDDEDEDFEDEDEYFEDDDDDDDFDDLEF